MVNILLTLFLYFFFFFPINTMKFRTVWGYENQRSAKLKVGRGRTQLVRGRSWRLCWADFWITMQCRMRNWKPGFNGSHINPPLVLLICALSLKREACVQNFPPPHLWCAALRDVGDSLGAVAAFLGAYPRQLELWNFWGSPFTLNLFSSGNKFSLQLGLCYISIQIKKCFWLKGHIEIAPGY